MSDITEVNINATITPQELVATISSLELTAVVLNEALSAYLEPIYLEAILDPYTGRDVHTTLYITIHNMIPSISVIASIHYLYAAPQALDTIAISVPAVPSIRVFCRVRSPMGTCTISQGSPAIVTYVGHGLIDGDKVDFTTTGVLPSPLATAEDYYITYVSDDTFTIGHDTTTAGSGIHTLWKVTP